MRWSRGLRAKKWRNVQSVVLKLPDSASLPVFTGELDPAKRKIATMKRRRRRRRLRRRAVVAKKGRKSLKAKLGTEMPTMAVFLPHGGDPQMRSVSPPTRRSSRPF